ncbi:MAG TPA: Xaa-Pro peptidase family protein [Vicinamibacterales bacterium]|nr:Xaa-Pro peptidase family protein [Vicinamibacterales bacterium]HOQ60556.1 Xaa-Pro peptidase family protein [Vicinamibacterales bacterium]
MPHPAVDLLAARHAAVRAAAAMEGLDGLVVFHLPNIRYLTGFAGSAAIAILTRDEIILITDGRYVTEVEETVRPGCPGLRLVKVDPAYDATLAACLGAAGAIRVGFESAHLSVKRHDALAAALRNASAGGGSAAALVPAERLVEACRMRKDAAELAALRRGGALIDAIAAAVLGDVRAGQPEWEVAAGIDDRIRRGGFERTSFETIVASGPNAALPHARPGRRVLQPGDLVVLDFGGVCEGYCTDITRTVSVGEPSAEARGLYEAVAAAHRAAAAAVRPGAPITDVDEAARAVLEARGFGTAFSHATGHGLGLEVHEEPRVGPRRPDIPGVPPAGRDDRLEPGIVFTIEPGAYVPGLGGVRIEDDVLVTPDGLEWLTGAPRGLRVV